MIGFQKAVALLGLCLSLQSCGNDGQREFYTSLWEGAKVSIPSKKKDALVAENASRQEDVLSQISAPLILASSGEFRTAFVRVSNNRGYEQWHSSSKVGLTFRDGLLTATRGLGGDLMDADVEESLERILSQSSQPATRIHRYLSGENTIVTRSFICIITSKGIENTSVIGRTRRLSLVSEACTNSDRTLENLYWIDPRDGFIWKSKQWVSMHVDAVTFERANR